MVYSVQCLLSNTTLKTAIESCTAQLKVNIQMFSAASVCTYVVTLNSNHIPYSTYDTQNVFLHLRNNKQST